MKPHILYQKGFGLVVYSPRTATVASQARMPSVCLCVHVVYVPV